MSYKKNILPATIGTVLEYYDFALYGAFSPIIANYYFAGSYKDNMALLTYFFSFLMRPLGALVFGYIGDKYGRKNAFGIPLIFMAIFTLAIAFIPSYSEIGVFSSILLIICRLGQGFCLGAEFGGAIVFCFEHNRENLSLVAGLIGSAVLLGSFLANLVSYIFTLNIFPPDYWKIPFIIGACIGIIGIWVRFKAEETPEFVSNPSLKNPLFEIMKEYKLPFVKTTICSGLNGFLGSFNFVYLNFFLVNNLGWEINQSLLLILFGHLISLSIAPIASKIAQNYRPENAIILTCCYLSLIIIPALLAIKVNNGLLTILGMFVISVATGLSWGSINLLLYKLFPPSVRYTGVAVGDSVGRMIFSAPVPFICNLFLTYFGILSISIIFWIFSLLIIFFLKVDMKK